MIELRSLVVGAKHCRCAEVRAMAAQQAEDPALWFMAQTASEAYLQQALRYIHAVIEGDMAMAHVLGQQQEFPACGT